MRLKATKEQIKILKSLGFSESFEDLSRQKAVALIKKESSRQSKTAITFCPRCYKKTEHSEITIEFLEKNEGIDDIPLCIQKLKQPDRDPETGKGLSPEMKIFYRCYAQELINKKSRV